MTTRVGPPVLLIVADGDAPRERIRGGDRRVCRWSADVAVPDTFTGDPEQPDTFAWLAHASAVSVVLDLEDRARAERIAGAVRTVRRDAAVLMLCRDCDDLPGDGTLARAGRLRDVLRLDLDEELERLEAERRVWLLRDFVHGGDIIPLLIHPDPDPDALASAFALRALLGGDPEHMPIVCTAPMSRPENTRMAQLLDAQVTVVPEDEIRRMERAIAVDMQPSQFDRPRFAIVDHHPPVEHIEAELRDVRPDYGATATMVTEYMRAVMPGGLGTEIATALLHGIRTDTDGLRRGVIREDVAAYAFLQERADPVLLRRFERPAYSVEAARALGRGVSRLLTAGDVAVCHLGDLAENQAHLLAEAADFCLGVENILWSASAARIDGTLELSLRHLGSEPGADSLAAKLAEDGGQGGGHATMARVRFRRAPESEMTEEALLERLSAAVASLSA